MSLPITSLPAPAAIPALAPLASAQPGAGFGSVLADAIGRLHHDQPLAGLLART